MDIKKWNKSKASYYRKKLDPPVENPEEIARLIKKARESRGISQTELARLVGYSGAYFSKMEKGIFPLKKYQIIIICNVLGITKEDLYDENFN